ncbi:MAG TPA: hypothetical protein VM238_10545 [Phycisphaerae bacterium]|nr:hypothetical protein [Phycisphaerae bacterium]
MGVAHFPFGHWPVGHFDGWHFAGAGGYLAYLGAGDEAGDVDFTEPVGGAQAGTGAIYLSGLGLAADTQYIIALRGVSDAGVVEEGTGCTCLVLVTAGDELEGARPNPLSSASAEQAAGGKLRVAFIYSRWAEPAAALKVQIAEVDGAPDWESPLAEVALNASGPTSWSEVLDDSWPHETGVILALRAVTAGGVAGDATTLDEIAVDAVGPDPLSEISAEQVS